MGGSLLLGFILILLITKLGHRFFFFTVLRHFFHILQRYFAL